MDIKTKLLLSLFPAAALTLLLFNALPEGMAFFALIFILVQILFIIRPEFGIYSMVAALPFTFISFRLPFSVIGEGVLPLIDAVSIMAFAGFVLNHLYFNIVKGESRKIKWPVFVPFMLFFSTLIISSFLSDNMFRSVWYSFRTIFVVYWFFVFLPVNVLDNVKKFKEAMVAFAAVSLGLSLLSIYSLMHQNVSLEFIRFRMLNKDLQDSLISFLARISDNHLMMYPFATEHLLLAEFLLSSFFIILALKKNYEGRTKRILNMLVLLVFVVLVGTFSRGIWLCLAIIGLVYNYDLYKVRLKKYFIAIPIIIVMLSPFLFYMYRLQSDYKVGVSSNENRLLSLSIAMDGFLERPFTGHGSGEFINIISDNIRYVSKFGNPPDAFGFWQKMLVENGILGLAFFVIFSLTVAKLAYSKMGPMRERSMILYLSAAALSVYIFEMTNVSYYTGKMWLPAGMLLAAIYLDGLNGKREIGFTDNNAKLDISKL